MPKKKMDYQADRCRVIRSHNDGSVTVTCKFVGAPVPIAVRIDAGTLRQIGRR